MNKEEVIEKMIKEFKTLEVLDLEQGFYYNLIEIDTAIKIAKKYIDLSSTLTLSNNG